MENNSCIWRQWKTSRLGRPIHVRPMRELERVSNSFHEAYVPRYPRRHEDDHHRRCFTIDGEKVWWSGRTWLCGYIRQAIYVEQLKDTHTQVGCYGLPPKSKSLIWYQTLGAKLKVSLASLGKDFILASSKMGINHDIVAPIHSFQLKDHETAKDCISQLQQYILRCLDEEKPSQARLIFVFLEGPKNKCFVHISMLKSILHSTNVF